MAEQRILDTIPHRPPFLFVDKILECTTESLRAERTIRAEEPQFEGHYPGDPIMPGVLLCEAVFQAAAYFLAKRMELEGESAEGKTPVLSRIEEAKFKQIVRPGDVLEIEVKHRETLRGFHFLDGKIRREGKMVMSVGCALAMVEKTH